MFNYDDEKLSKSSFAVITIFVIALIVSILFLSLKINKNGKELSDKTYQNGESAYEIAVRNGYTGTLEEFNNSLIGLDGGNGKTVYEIAVESGYFSGTKEEWEEFIKGSNGKTGDDGKTLYEYALENGFTGTQDDFNNLLIKIANGGERGEDGEKGSDAISLKSFTSFELYESGASIFLFNLTDGSSIIKAFDNFGTLENITNVFPTVFPLGIDLNDIKIYATIENVFGAYKTIDLRNSSIASIDLSKINTNCSHPQETYVYVGDVKKKVELVFRLENPISVMTNPLEYQDEIDEYVIHVEFNENYVVHPLLDDSENTLILKGLKRCSNVPITNADLVYGVDFIFDGGTLDDVKLGKYKDVVAPNGFKVVSVPIIPASFEYDPSLHEYYKTFDKDNTIIGYFYETTNNDIILDFDIQNDGTANLIFDTDLVRSDDLFMSGYNLSNSMRLSLKSLYIDGRVVETPLYDEYLNFHDSKSSYIEEHFTEANNNTVQTIYTKGLTRVSSLNEYYVCHTEIEEDSRRIYYKYIKEAEPTDFVYSINFSYDLLGKDFDCVQALILKKEDGKLKNEVMENMVTFVIIKNNTNQYSIPVSFDDVLENLDLPEDFMSKDYLYIGYNFEYDLGNVHLEKKIKFKLYLYEEISSQACTYFDYEYYNLDKGEIESIDIMYYDVYHLYNNGLITFITEPDNPIDFMNFQHISKDQFSEYILNDVDLTTPGTKILIVKRDDSNEPFKLYMELYNDEYSYNTDELNESLEYTQSVGDSLIKFLSYLKRLNQESYPVLTGTVGFTLNEMDIDFSMINFDIPVDSDMCFTEAGLYEIKVMIPYTNHESVYKVRVKEAQESKDVIKEIILDASIRITTKFVVNTIYLHDDFTCDLALNIEIFDSIDKKPFIIENARYEEIDGGYLIYSDNLGTFKILKDIDDDYYEYVSPIKNKVALERYNYSVNGCTIDLAIYSDNTLFIQVHDGDEVKSYYLYEFDDELNINGNFNLKKLNYTLDGVEKFIYYLEEEHCLTRVYVGR